MCAHKRGKAKLRTILAVAARHKICSICSTCELWLFEFSGWIDFHDPFELWSLNFFACSFGFKSNQDFRETLFEVQHVPKKKHNKLHSICAIWANACALGERQSEEKKTINWCYLLAIKSHMHVKVSRMAHTPIALYCIVNPHNLYDQFALFRSFFFFAYYLSIRSRSGDDLT